MISKIGTVLCSFVAANMCSWKDGAAFEALLNYLLRQKGKEPVIVSSPQVSWYCVALFLYRLG